MSRKLISRSPDLQRLRDEGYDIEVRAGRFLLLKNVPYVTAERKIASGTLVSTLNLAGDISAAPETHVATWIGEHPCRPDGTRIPSIQHGSARQELDRGLVVDHSFSNKLTERNDADYYEKMTRYATIIAGQAQAIDFAVTPKVNRFIEDVEEDSPFVYSDTASSNDGIVAVTRKLEVTSVGIVGLGGTGSYILDLVAKTPVRKIHLFDGDPFLQHNAFRAPGAASVDELRTIPDKVAYLKDRYSRMHRGIVEHAEFLEASNLETLRGLDFVFLAMDRGRVKLDIVEKLLAWKIPFIDAAMGVDVVDETLGGIVTITTVTPQYDGAKDRMTFSDANPDDDYSRNIQIADLNALNAAMAVIKWKKYLGFYRDIPREHFSTYTIDANFMTKDHEVA